MVQLQPIFQLQDVVSIDTLREILNQFSEVTGINTLITDYTGKPIVLHDKLMPFCERLRQYPEGCDACETTDAYGGLSAARKNGPHIYRCHMGLVEAAVPIVVNGQYLGTIFTGNVNVEDEDLEKFEQIYKSNIQLTEYADLDTLYKEHIQSLPHVSLARLQAYTRLLYTMANYIAEIGFRNIVQKQLNAKELLVLQKSATNAKLERNLAQLELRNIQTQMNPHFIFNTLNSINHQAILEGAEITPQIISAFAAILRRSLRKIDQLSTLGEEFECIKNYIFIKKICFRDRIMVETKIDEACLDAEIPILTIQPLVENAFLHGLEPKEEGGKILITSIKEKNSVKIQIKDDGLGMPDNILKEILELKSQSNRPNKTKSLGIHNSIRILNHFFGEEFSWDVKSHANIGTVFTIKIPYQKSNCN